MKLRVFPSEKSLMNSVLLTEFPRTAKKSPAHSSLFSRPLETYLLNLLILALANSIHFPQEHLLQKKKKKGTSGLFQPTFVVLRCALQPELLLGHQLSSHLREKANLQNTKNLCSNHSQILQGLYKHHNKFNSQTKVNNEELPNLSWHLS